jgi:hypothetical protein
LVVSSPGFCELSLPLPPSPQSPLQSELNTPPPPCNERPLPPCQWRRLILLLAMRLLGARIGPVLHWLVHKGLCQAGTLAPCSCSWGKWKTSGCQGTLLRSAEGDLRVSLAPRCWAWGWGTGGREWYS